MKTSKQALSGEEFFVSARDICSWHWICVGFCLMMREYWASNVGEAGKSLYNGGKGRGGCGSADPNIDKGTKDLKDWGPASEGFCQVNLVIT